uniref:Myosin-10-like isoform X5 n=1 Tax=Crassostrea virginica TaxID=6565 RepID=A0A8B8DFZ3_CRAVI|nr:myosin-10-like isoform X5 [Crassostrea virginica]
MLNTTQGTTLSGKVKGNSSALKSPRLCEDDIEIKITTKSERNRRYAAEDYEDRDADFRHRYFNAQSFCGIIPTTPTGTSGRTLQRGRPRRLLQPSTKADFENRQEKAQGDPNPRREYILKNEQEYIDQIRRLTEENKDLKKKGNLSEQCSTLQKEKASLLKDNEDAQTQIKELKRSSQSMEREIESLTNELRSYRNSNEDLLSIHDKERGLFEKGKKSAGIEISELKRALHDKEKKIESLNDELRRSKEHVVMLSNEVQLIQESKEQAISNSEKRFHTENASLQSDYKMAILKNSDLTEQCLVLKEEKVNLVKDKEDGQRQIKELKQSSQAKENKIESLTNELTSYRNSNEDLLSIHDKEKGLFEKDKKRAGIEISELKRALQDKEKEIRSLNDELKSSEDLLSIHDKEKGLLEKDKKRAVIEINALKRALHDKKKEIGSINDELRRCKEHVAMLSNEVQLIQKSREEAVSSSEKRFHKEKASLQSDYEKAILKNGNFSEQCSTLQKEKASLLKDKGDAQKQIKELKRTTQSMERKIESLTNELTRNSDLTEQCLVLKEEKVNLIKDKEDGQRQIKELRQTSQSMERKIETLFNELTSYQNSNEDLLSINDKERGLFEKDKKRAGMEIIELKRALQDKEKEIRSLNDELRRNGDLSEQCITLKREKANLMKDKEDAQLEIRTLRQTSQSMERKIGSLTNELTSYRNSNEDLLSIHDKEKGRLEKDKKRAYIEINDLKRALHDKEKEFGSINDELNRFKEHVAMLSNEVQLIHKSREEAVSSSEKRFHKEKASLQSDYEKAILKINNISKECANLHKDKKSSALLAEKLSKTVEDREAKIHSLEAELSQFKEQITRLSIENKTLHSSKSRAVDEKMQEHLKENYSLKTDLAKATSKSEDLSKKCENMQRDYEEAEHNIRQLTRAVQNKDQEITFMTAELTRVEDSVQELKDQKRDGQTTEQKIRKLSRHVLDKEDGFDSLKEQLLQSEDKNAALEEKLRNVKVGGGSVHERMQQLQDANTTLQSALVEKSTDRFMEVPPPRRRNRLFVASIDFGTTYSGYAFSSKDEWERDPMNIHKNVWNSSNLMSAKTPTALMLGPKREFLAFGYDAETKYSESEGSFASYYYFHCFKLILQDNDNLNCDTLIRDATGKALDAMTVFSISIKYITDHLFKSLSNNFPEIEMDDIHFVLTVPAIWDQKAKQFMTEAALRAGIPNEQLSIAMEQETAAIYYREDNLSQDKDKTSNLTEGMNFMVVDLGGGTTDITFHRSLDNGKFEEIRPPTGGPWGGQNVNEAFFNFIAELFGQSVIDKLKKMHMDDYLDLERHFEIKKRSIASNKTGSVKINFPLIVFQLANEMNKTESVCDIITQNAKYAGKIKTEAQKLQIPTEILISLFRPTIGEIIEHIHTILKENTNEVDVILMVGGFAECDIVQNEFKKNFSDKKIIVPEEAGLAVMKGAVLYGHMQ